MTAPAPSTVDTAGSNPAGGSAHPARFGRVARGSVAAVLAVVTILPVAACSDEPVAAPPVAGGAAALPGPTPSDLALRPAPADSPPAPAITGPLTDGTPLAVADLWADRPVVLSFFSSWCTTCAQRQDALSDLARNHAGRVAFVGVVGEDTAEDVQDYLRTHRVGYPVLVDTEQRFWRSYAVREPPAVVLVARGGALLRGFPGGVDAPTLDRLLADLVLAP
ncbi:TlpA disulfide reductase family protein [Solwaraspora sp. WMMD1047]|uniref:TlpA family protein disulfide reductase n=1 Tax=Solwaraspora sp. WMMD1047 TaxID=3016102 RepID=UPI0024176FC4|nr:TlpA disulfide reductase family protein [Solwaraspora sp. WMMD1047]MDG4830781.1 TlpA disulfide reductase family protein [Solwaraspora sp. WMMD1047]